MTKNYFGKITYDISFFFFFWGGGGGGGEGGYKVLFTVLLLAIQPKTIKGVEATVV